MRVRTPVVGSTTLILAVPGSATWAFQKTNDGYDATTTVSISPEDTTLLLSLLDQIDSHADVEDVFINAI